MKINMGCGHKRIPGYTGVDVVQSRGGVDIVAPVNSVPLPDAVADEIMAIHVIEHVPSWDVPDTLREWARLLKPGGLLVMEQPDLLKCCRNILEGKTRQGKHPDQLGMYGLFGDDRLKDRYMLHAWSYHFGTLAPLVEAAGFVECRELETRFHGTGRGVRDFRLEARRA